MYFLNKFSLICSCIIYFNGSCVYAQSAVCKVVFKILTEQNKAVKGAHIWIKEADKDYFSDRKGLYVTYLKPSFYEIRIQKNKYLYQHFSIQIQRDTLIKIQLNVNSNFKNLNAQKRKKKFKGFDRVFELDEVEVFAMTDDKMLRVEQNTERLTQTNVNEMPSFFGEKDAIKTMQLLPGIQAQSEGSSEYIVRGGKPDQNLLLLDGMPMYSMSHLFGMVSALNPLMVDEVKLHKADAPANLGGRVSSFLEASSKLPSSTQKSQIIELGLLSSKVTFEFPLIKDKMGLSFGLRRSLFFDLPYHLNLANEGFNFTDAHISVHYQINSKHRLFSSNFLSSDGGLFYDDYSINQNTRTKIYKGQFFTTIQLHSAWSEKWKSSVKMGMSSFKNAINEIENREGQHTLTKYFGNIKDYLLHPSISFNGNQYRLSVGIENIVHQINPVSFSETVNSIKSLRLAPIQQLTAISPYFMFRYKYKEWKLNTSLRNSNYLTSAKQYHYFEPRLSLTKSFSPKYRFEFAYSKLSQGLHRVYNSGLGFPIDLLFPSNSRIIPQVSQNFSCNFIHAFNYNQKRYTLSLSTYYRKIVNTINYLDGYDSQSLLKGGVLFKNTPDEILTTGSTDIKGFDIQLDKSIGYLTGWISYSYLRAVGLYPKLNRGVRFPEDFDRTHQINLVGVYHFNKRTSVSASWSYLRGRPITFSTQYNLQPILFPNDMNKFSNVYLAAPTERNSIRTIPFHRLDISGNFQTSLFKREAELSIGIFNVYNRANPNFYYVKTINQSQDLRYVSFFHLLPTFSLKIYLHRKK